MTSFPWLARNLVRAISRAVAQAILEEEQALLDDEESLLPSGHPEMW